MLVLARKKYQTIVIEGGIRITIVDIYKDKVRLGIEAPSNIQVNREEVYNKKVETGFIKEENNG